MMPCQVRFYCIGSRVTGAALLARAAAGGHAAALYALAVVQFNGSGGDKADKDPRAGVALCARAAWLGHVPALRELGHCLQDGYGARRDAAAGRHFLLHAAARELVSSSLHHLPPFHHRESTTSFLTSTSTSSASAGLGCGAGTAPASARRRGHGVDGGREHTEAEPQRRDLSEQGLTLGAPPGPLPLPSLLHVEPPRLLALLPGRRR